MRTTNLDKKEKTMGKKDLDGVSTDKLNKMIQERKKWLKKVCRFVFQVIEECGVEVSRHERNSNTHIVRRVLKFYGFNIELSVGETQFGGCSISIIYGGVNLLNLASDTRAFAPDECRVSYITPNPLMIIKLDVTIRNKKRLIERYKKRKEREKKAKLQKEEDSRKHEELKSAERLKL
jgi:hypothetical protein